jgi:hypothetical protein
VKYTAEQKLFIYNIVAYLLKARTAEPEKQPLLVNGSEPTFISGQQLSKHIPAAMDMNTTIEELCFLSGPCQDVISKEQG